MQNELHVLRKASLVQITTPGSFIHSFKKKSLSTHNNPETIISIKDITGNEANENPFVYEISSGDSVPFGLLGA